MSDDPEELPFDHKEDLLNRLADLVRGYPVGLGLVKEFLQNADDAGASWLRVIYDKSQYPGTMPRDDQMQVLGPALLFVNDRVFSAPDFANIQRIGGRGKLKDAGRTGRFGQGFSTSFSVSDQPTLLTGDRVAWFDPHQKALLGRPARAWLLSIVEKHWPAWAATFHAAKWEPGTPSFPGAAFRLPIRSEAIARKSQIRDVPFTDESFETLLQEVKAAGPTLLVFLRSVQEISVEEIEHDGNKRLRYRLSTNNKAEVEEHRVKLRNRVQGDPAIPLTQWLQNQEELPIIPFVHSFCIESSDGAQEHESWAVVTGLFRGDKDRLIDKALAICSHQEKALPWAGAAVRLSSASEAPAGGLACFLPLPKSVPWPVWLHGWFDLDSNRRDITRTAGSDEVDRLRLEWNKLLLHDAVGAVWPRLLEFLQTEPGFAARPYRLWPQPSAAQDEYDKVLVQGFYTSAGQRPVLSITGPNGHGWQRLPAPHVDHLGASRHAELRGPLLAAGRTLFDPPLPTQLVEALEDGGFPIDCLNACALAQIVSNWMRGDHSACELTAVPQPALRDRKWILALARSVSQDNKEFLKGLPLALLADGRLHTFGKCGPIYVMNQEERELFACLPHRMLDLEFQATVGIHDSVAALDIRALDLAGVSACVQEVCKQQQLSQNWAACVFDYLERIPRDKLQKNRPLVQALPIVPDHNGSWHSMGSVETPNAASGLSSGLRDVFVQLGVPLLSGSAELIQAIDAFRNRHPGFIEELSPDRLATLLSAHVDRSSLNVEALRDIGVVTAILDYLSPPSWLSNNNPRRAKLKIPMFPAVGGAILSADTKGISYLSDFDLPASLGIQQQVLETGQDGHWLPLLRSLAVDEQNALNFITKALLSSFAESHPAQQDTWLRWLRDNLQSILARLSESEKQTLRSELRSAAILPVRGGQPREPRRTYRPDAEDAIRLLGDRAFTPDADRLADQPQLWKAFFVELDLNLQPLAEDLIEAIRGCAGQSMQIGTAAVKERIVALFEHVTDNWDRLGNPQKGGTLKFANALSNMPWLLACQYDPEDVAAAKIWPDRLYKGSELSPQRHRNLLASLRPILYGKEPSPEVLTALGLPLQIDFDDVLRHFTAVLSLPLPGTADDDRRRDALRNACVAFLEHLGGLGDAALKRAQSKFASLLGKPCIYLRSQWWPPQRVFLETIPFASTWLASISEDTNIAARPAARTGLSRLEIKAKPGPADWVALLLHMAESFKDEPLSDSALQEAYAALQQLRSAENQWLRTNDVRVPTQDHKLVLARATFLADDPRLRTQTAQCYIPVVSDAEEAQDVGERAGARSLLASLEDRLTEPPLSLELGEDAEWAADCVRKIQSPAFGLCLRRIALHEAITGGNDKRQADVRAGQVTSCSGFNVLVTANLTVQSVLPATNQVVFVDPNATGFLDAADDIIWVRQGSRRAMTGELVRAISRHTGIADTLRLRDLLDTEPDDMESLLNEEGVAMLTQGATGFRPSDQRTENSDDIGHDRDDRHADPHLGNGGYPWPSGPNDGGGSGSPRPEVPSPLRRPGDGSSNPWTPERQGPSGGAATRRMRSYGHPVPQQDYDTGPVEGAASEAAELQRRARTKAREWEERHGRVLVAENPLFSDFDLLTGEGENRRFIKVKALVGPWSVRGVALSRSHAEAARAHGRAWWLYVVEFVQDPLRSRVLPVLNPVLHADEFRFDDGWIALAEGQTGAAIPRTGMQVQLDDGRSAVVLDVEDCTPFFEVLLRFEDGTEDSLTWQQRWFRSE